MERIKDHLMALGHHIANEMGLQKDFEGEDNIAEMCEDFNDEYKFYCHFKALKDGIDPREHAPTMGAPR